VKIVKGGFPSQKQAGNPIRKREQVMSTKQLWAPWRMEFLKATPKTDGCIFCTLPKAKDDKKSLIVFQADKVFVILNKYPYTNGHLMVVPYQHTADLSDLSAAETNEMWAYAQMASDALKKEYKPEGFNIGMNIGKAAGAGIKEHLHLHVVPRWVGDTNFMPVLSDTKSMPEHLEASYDRLKKHFRRLT
jgi:ATP adenylyltransferase